MKLFVQTTLGSLLVLLVTAGCSTIPGRPQNVPASAVYVPGVKGGYWQTCRIEQSSGECRCSIYLADGRNLYDEVFRPYEGAAPSEEEDLVITPEGNGRAVKLANGTLLLPTSEYENEKRYWDWITDKSETY